MRLDTAREETITNLGGSQKFKMNASAKAFQILSSGIYERKIEAIVRELSCNAYDSHVMADKAEVPFRIQLPTPINDFIFAIEDFGVGLSEFEVAGGFHNETTGVKVPWSVAHGVIEKWKAQVQECLESGVEDSEIPEHPYLSNGFSEVGGVYTTYFESTKTDSNDVIGALGLGSKTPFSYTDSFTVKARKEGKECVFSAQISASGEPEVVKMYERPWAGDNGVEVSVEVASRDVNEFRDCAQKVLSWFDVKPECNRDLLFNVEEQAVANVRQYGYHLEPKTGFGRRVDCKVVMGNVAYDLDLNAIKPDTQDELARFIDQLYNMKADVYFSIPIGDADVAASRETLSLDDRTKDNLRERLRFIQTNFEATTKAKLPSFSNVIQAFFALTPYERKVVENEVINGFTLKEYMERGGSISAYVEPKNRQAETAEERTMQELFDKYDIAVYTSNNRRWGSPMRNKRERSDSVMDLHVDHVIPVIINDCERKMGLKDAICQNSSLRSSVVVVSDKDTKLDATLTKVLNYMTFNSFKVIYASTFWDGKLSTNKSTSTGLASETVKAQVLTQDTSYFVNKKIDLSGEDKSRWAFLSYDGGSIFTVRFKDESYNLLTTGEIKAVMKELDLVGVVGYNGNNEKKVKRIIGESRNLAALIEGKATIKAYQKALERDELSNVHKNYFEIFDGYVSMCEAVKDTAGMDNLMCSKLRYERSNKVPSSSVLNSLRNRIEVFEDQIKLLRESSVILSKLLTTYDFKSSMIPEVKQFIAMKKKEA